MEDKLIQLDYALYPYRDQVKSFSSMHVAKDFIRIRITLERHVLLLVSVSNLSEEP